MAKGGMPDMGHHLHGQHHLSHDIVYGDLANRNKPDAFLALFALEGVHPMKGRADLAPALTSSSA
eukprot:1161340-Pelagomonas_calceolata.AAC.10